MSTHARYQRSPALEWPGDVRGRVLHAAVQLIDEGGLDRLSMREVARVAGVSHQAPYHYFADREAILAAIAEAGFQTLGQRLQAVQEGVEPPAERLGYVARAYIEFGLDHPALFRVMFRKDVVDTDRFPECRVQGDLAFDVPSRVVADAIAAGLPPEPSPISLVVAFWSFAHGLTCLLLDGPLMKKIPDAAADREQLVSDAVLAIQRLVEARLPPPKKKKRKS